MASIEPIKITGLAEFNRNLRKLNNDLPKALRIAHNTGAQIVVDYAQAHVPSRRGRARRSIKAKSTRTESRVSGGSKAVPYYPWLDFGGRVGPRRSVHRPFEKGGRYLYPGYHKNADRVHDVLVDALLDVARQAGVEVTSE